MLHFWKNVLPAFLCLLTGIIFSVLIIDKATKSDSHVDQNGLNTDVAS